MNNNNNFTTFMVCYQQYQYLFYNSWFFIEMIKSLSFIDYLLIIIIIIIGILLYKWIILPVNWVEDLTDVGFDDILGKNKKIHKGKKASIIHEIQKRKKIGEIPPVYPNGWYALLESNCLQPGDVQYVSALDENFAVIRNINGEISILDAYCPHLGANLAIGGVVRNNCIECPFHGWRFNTQNGQCIGIPYSEKVPDIIKIKKWISNEINDLIFVWYHIENVEPTYTIEYKTEIKTKKWIYCGRNEFKINCHIQEIPENGCDIAHLESIHSLPVLNGSKDLILPEPNLYKNNNKSFSTFILSYLFKHIWFAKWERDPILAHKTNIHLTHDFKLLNKVSLMYLDVRVTQIGPSYVELLLNHSMGTMIITQTVLPEGPLLQKVIHRIYCPWYMSVLAKCAIIGESIMFKRDMVVWNHKKYLDKPFLVKNDGNIMQFRRWFNQFFSVHSKKYSFQNNNYLDW